jgi:hypothetical protein
MLSWCFSVDVAKFYGFGNDYKSIWHQMKPITTFAKQLQSAIANRENVDVIEFKSNAKRTAAKKSSGDQYTNFHHLPYPLFIFTITSGCVLLLCWFLLGIARAMGGDCTGSACENRFRRIKQDAKAINAALKNGIDPMTLNIGEQEVSNRSAPRSHGWYNVFSSDSMHNTYLLLHKFCFEALCVDNIT